MYKCVGLSKNRAFFSQKRKYVLEELSPCVLVLPVIDNKNKKTIFYFVLCLLIRTFATAYCEGEVLEWLKRHAWKACNRQNRFAGSNPVLSAKQEKRIQSSEVKPRGFVVLSAKQKNNGNQFRFPFVLLLFPFSMHLG